MIKDSNPCWMTRRDLLRAGFTFGGSALGMAAVGSISGILPWTSNALAAGIAKPNVVLIYCDDLGYGDLGCYGGKAIATPNIDRLAQSGVRMTDYYSCNAVCAPSRAGLLTGRYPIRSGVIGNIYPDDEPLKRVIVREYFGAAFQSLGGLDVREGKKISGIPERELLLGEALQGAGYRTGMVGKWHLGDYSLEPSYNPVRNGFDFYFGVPHSNDMLPCPLFRNDKMLEPNIGTDQARLTSLYTEESIQFLKESKGNPFFLYFAHTFAHQPLYASEKFAGKSKAGKYGDAVEEIDWSVGRIMETLVEMGVENETLLIFTSDNGPWYEGSAGSLRGRKGQSYEGGFRVPMIASWPGRIPSGTVSSQAMMNIDFYPTILSLAGVNLPKDRVIDGRNVMNLLSGKDNTPPHEALFFYHYDLLEGIRVGNWKYFRRINRYTWPVPLDGVQLANKLGGDQLGKRWPLLYNLETDPGESYNVIDTYPEVAGKLDNMMLTWESETKENPGGWL